MSLINPLYKPGNGVHRHFRNSRKAFRIGIILSGISLPLAVKNAKQQDLFLTTMWGINSCMGIKFLANSYQKMKALSAKEYELLQRALRMRFKDFLA